MSGLLLAIDTSTSEGSAALAREGGVLLGERRFRTREGHSATLLPEIEALVAEAGATPADLMAVVIAAGPGSFTGLRVAAATAKGLVHARGLELYAYSTLLAVAGAADSPAPVCALLDARRDEVFHAVYRFGERVEELGPPAVGMIDEVVSAAAAGTVFTGPGATRHAARIIRERGEESLVPPQRSTAAVLLELAHDRRGEGRVADPPDWEPEYLRASGAERIRAEAGGG
jgi:tRNA threonylcarbamoyladenosine biosynthesis protein TsaB